MDACSEMLLEVWQKMHGADPGLLCVGAQRANC